MGFVKPIPFVCMWLLLASTLGLSQANPVPFVNQPLVPDATAPGGPGFTLAVNGTGFVSGAAVNWNGRALTTTFVNQSQVTATVPAADIATAGTASVTVTNPAPGGGTSSVQYFGITDPALAVTFAEFDSASGLDPSADILALSVADFNLDSRLDLLSACVMLGVGDGSFGPLLCNPASLEGLTGTVQDFTLAAVPPTSQTVTVGQAANYSLTVSPLLGFNQSVALTCSGAPAASTCAVTPGSLPGSGAANIAVVTTGSSAGLTQPFLGPPANGLAVSLALSGLLGVGLLAAWTSQLQRPQLRYALALLCLLSVGGIVSCGDDGGGGNGGGGTPTGTYTLTVTGTFSSGGVALTHNTEFTLVVR